MLVVRSFKVFCAILISGLLVGIVGCDVGVKIDVEAKTRQILQNAIDELGRQPGRWGTTLNGAIDELGKMGVQLADEIRWDVQSLYTQSLQTTQEAAFCSADFIGIRVRQEMQAIMHKYFSDVALPDFTPVICTIDPVVIQSDSTTQVLYSGFDFIAFQNTGSFTADLYYADNGELVQTGFGGVSVATNYKIVVDIQSVDWGRIDGGRHPQLVLRWNSATVVGESEIPINIALVQVPPTATFPACVWTNAVSEETGERFCPSGYAMNGVSCEHDYCDNMSLYCCPYTNGVDQGVQGHWSNYLSEETGADGVTSASEFVTGMRCQHDYCDNVSLYYITTSNLINGDQCYFAPSVSEEEGKRYCSDGEYVAGMSCFGEYCDNVSLYCCHAIHP